MSKRTMMYLSFHSELRPGKLPGMLNKPTPGCSPSFLSSGSLLADILSGGDCSLARTQAGRCPAARVGGAGALGFVTPPPSTRDSGDGCCGRVLRSDGGANLPASGEGRRRGGSRGYLTSGGPISTAFPGALAGVIGAGTDVEATAGTGGVLIGGTRALDMLRSRPPKWATSNWAAEALRSGFSAPCRRDQEPVSRRPRWLAEPRHTSWPARVGS
jgi:hypothetical protein